MKIGVMGASFDPPHKAHIAIAAAAADFLRLDSVIFVPAFCAPLKDHAHFANFEDRCKMLELALEGFAYPYEISRIEAQRGGLSYSVDTAAEIKKNNPQAELFWILGSDQVRQLHKWKDIKKLSEIVSFVCFKRTNYPFEKNEELPLSVKILQSPFEAQDVSSSKIRAELKNPQKHLDLMGAKVLDYIRKNNIYKYG